MREIYGYLGDCGVLPLGPASPEGSEQSEGREPLIWGPTPGSSDSPGGTSDALTADRDMLNSDDTRAQPASCEQHSRVASRRASVADLGAFLEQFHSSLIILSGLAHGMEIPLDQARLTLGRGPGVDLAFDDPSLSRVHAVIEFNGSGFRVRDLAGTGGIRVNGESVLTTRLSNGDTLQLGAQRI